MDIQYARMADLGDSFSRGMQIAQQRQNMAQMRFEQDQKQKELQKQELIKQELQAGLQKFGSASEALKNIKTSPMAGDIYPYLAQMAEQEYKLQSMPIDMETARLGLESKKKSLLDEQEASKRSDINRMIFTQSLEQDPLKRKMGLDLIAGTMPRNQYESGIPVEGSKEQLQAYALGPEEYTKNFLKEGVGLNFDERMALQQNKNNVELEKLRINKLLREQDQSIRSKGLNLKEQEFGLKSQEKVREFAKEDADLEGSIEALSAKSSKFADIRNSVSNIYNNEDLWGNSGFGKGLSVIPESSASNIKAELEYAVASLLPNAVKEAKQAGATFGAMTEGEWKKLESSIANLNPNQSPENYRANVGRILKQVETALSMTANEIKRSKKRLGATNNQGKEEKKTNNKDPLGLGL